MNHFSSPFNLLTLFSIRTICFFVRRTPLRYFLRISLTVDGTTPAYVMVLAKPRVFSMEVRSSPRRWFYIPDLTDLRLSDRVISKPRSTQPSAFSKSLRLWYILAIALQSPASSSVCPQSAM